MLLSELSIRRPVFAISLSLIIILMGILSLFNLGLQQYPQIDEPTLTVKTQYYGASPTIVESKVTSVLEDVFSGLSGLDYMNSSSKAGISEIYLHFIGGQSIADVSAAVRERIAQVQEQLPKNSKTPIVIKHEANQREFLFLVLTSPNHNELELCDYAERNLKGTVQAIPGVANAIVYGNSYTMQIHLNREKLKTYNLAVTDVLDTLENNSKDYLAGNIIKGLRHVNVVTKSSLNTPEEMGNLVLSREDARIIHLKDVATITLGKDSEDVWQPRFDKIPAAFLAISKTSEGNMLATSKDIIKKIELLKNNLPAGMKLEPSFNFSVFIEASLKSVQHTIIEATILVLLIIFIFLRSLKATFIPLVTIPISLIGSFFFLYAFNCSINTLTLLAMVLAIGLVVDDAIVVLENIYRYIEKGLSPFEAALKGSHEIGFAIIAMTLTLASVYTPIVFVHGLTGQLFFEFAVTLAGAVLISGFVALTLSPMMCAYLLKPQQEEIKKPWMIRIENFFHRINQNYHKGLTYCLNAPKTMGVVLLVVFSGGSWLFTHLPVELAPQEDQGIIMSWTQGPEGTTIDTVLDYTKNVENIFDSVPEKTGTFAIAARTGVYAGITLNPWGQRKRSQSDIISALRDKFKAIPGVQAYVFPMRTILTGGQSGLQIAIKTTHSYTELEQTMNTLTKELKKSPYFESVSHDLLLNMPQIDIHINREKAGLMDIAISDIGKTLETMLGGSRISTFEMDGRHYDIVVRTDIKHQKNIHDIGNFFVKPDQKLKEEGKEQKLIPLHQLISLKEIAIPPEIKHFGTMRSATLEAELVPGASFNKALETFEITARKILPSYMQIEYAGNLRKFKESSANMYFIFAAALFFIFLVLAIQFESFIDPLLIMFTVPLSMTGALLALYLSGCSLNIFSQVGLITLVGLITKHGILIVEFANKRLASGMPLIDAITEAASLRLRPIMMTTGAMVLGAIPLALGSGAGAETRHQIGWVLVGGLLFGTLLTVFIIPFIYLRVKSLDLGWLPKNKYEKA